MCVCYVCLCYSLDIVVVFIHLFILLVSLSKVYLFGVLCIFCECLCNLHHFFFADGCMIWPSMVHNIHVLDVGTDRALILMVTWRTWCVKNTADI